MVQILQDQEAQILYEGKTVTMLSKTNFKIKVDIKNRNFKEYSIKDYEKILKNLSGLKEKKLLLEGEVEHIVAALSKHFKIKRRTVERDLLSFLQENTGTIVEDLKPYEGEVNGSELGNNIESILKQYVYLENEAQYTAITLWIFLTYCFHKFNILPMLLITSPVMRCGKTTLLTILEGLVNRALIASNISPSAVFRTIEGYKPTLLLDEADTGLAENEELRGIINAGHTKRTAFVIRTGSKEVNFEPGRFDTFCPKAIALIGSPSNTWKDRSVHIKMERKPSDLRVEKLPNNFYEEKKTLREKLLKWASGLNVPEVLEGNFGLVNDRAEDNWQPLIYISQNLSNEWLKKAKEAMFALEGAKEAEDNDLKIQLLRDIRECFKEKGDKISSADLIDFLCNLAHKPWCEINRGRPITQAKLAKFLKEFGIKPKLLRIENGPCRGYELSQFLKVFNSYIPPSQSVTLLQPRNDKGFEDFQSVTKKENVTLSNESLHLSRP